MTKKVEAKMDEQEPGDAAEVTTIIIRVACILIIGVVILNGVVSSASLDETDAFYNLSQSVIGNIESCYTLAALMILALGASAIMRYMGFL
ncbi:hypothetical protein RE474_11450 [Methanolobus sediminis]|uniref:Uncharacterized protein n=1 Tax=Methanolobus sediminis TaxID=3072978 RepID=A0AA51YLM9_9EURY|nr:hypothetical protein [Methanolobus sediminis]WMW24688.1 hypothetical protein RE474_11450 [Methanolobus sediminis]